DVAVVGAGPAGTAAALFAARRGYRVIVFDKRAFPRDKPCGEGLMPGGRPALRELGLEEAIVSGGAPPPQGIQFGPAGQPPVAVPFPEHGGEQAGLGIRRLAFDARLVDARGQESRIQFCPQTEARNISPADGGSARGITAARELRTPGVRGGS